jgi:hypothetical protein
MFGSRLTPCRWRWSRYAERVSGAVCRAAGEQSLGVRRAAVVNQRTEERVDAGVAPRVGETAGAVAVQVVVAGKETDTAVPSRVVSDDAVGYKRSPGHQQASFGRGMVLR